MLCKKNQCGVETCGPGGTWPPSLITRGGPAPRWNLTSLSYHPLPAPRWILTPFPNHQRGPRTLLPPSFSLYTKPGHWRFSLLRSSQQGWIWSGDSQPAQHQPSTNPMLLDNVCNITLISLRKLYFKCLSNDWLPSTDCCYILGWLTTTRNKWDSPMCVHHIFLGCSEQIHRKGLLSQGN